MILVDCVLPKINVINNVITKLKEVAVVVKLSIKATVFDTSDDEDIYLQNEDGQIIQNENGERIKNY